MEGTIMEGKMNNNLDFGLICMEFQPMWGILIPS